MIAPEVEKLAGEHSNIKFVKFDTTEFTEEMGVLQIPGFAFYDKGSKLPELVQWYKKKVLSDMVGKLSAGK